MIKDINFFPKRTHILVKDSPEERVCGECTKCCDGTLKGEAYGHKFDKGYPCYFLKNSKCSIYPNHPEHPCKSYKCYWLQHKEIPEYMRPDRSLVIMTERTFENFEYLQVLEAGAKIDSSILSEIIQNCFSKNLNLEYEVDGIFFRLGSKEFLARASEVIQQKNQNL